MKENIRNIIFDMGKVLIGFDPEIFMDRAGIFDPADRKIIRREIYDSPRWTAMDQGDLDEKEMIRIVKPVLPEHLRNHADYLIGRWFEPIIPVEGMEELVCELKERGYGIYLLSNASVMQKVYWPTILCAKYFDGTVVSADEHVMKPDEKIYTILLERYGLKASECIYIDDREENVSTAGRLGMCPYQFDGDVRKLRAFIEKLLSE
ncbi:MAG: HAD family phosphatase [Solobacterium sp.]|nr:HAD family phosphatase [Solobacterium sp.]